MGYRINIYFKHNSKSFTVMEIGSGQINNLFNFPYDLDDDNGYFMENGVNEINCMKGYKRDKILTISKEGNLRIWN